MHSDSAVMWRPRARRYTVTNRLGSAVPGCRCLTHYRHLSTVLALLTVMDSFVNDRETEPSHGLHARGSEDMQAWDSVADHPICLAHAHRTFSRDDSEPLGLRNSKR